MVKATGSFKLVFLGLLLTFAIVVHVIEAAIPVPIPVPGAKLGLANIITLVVLLLFGYRQGFLISVLRAVLGSFFIGTFLSFGFILSVVAAAVSTTVMVLVMPLQRRGHITLVSVSILGAVSHNVAQLFTASILVQNFMLFRGYLPLLLLLAIPTGFFTGLAAGFLQPVINRAMGRLQAGINN